MFQRNFYEIKRILDCFPPKIPTCKKNQMSFENRRLNFGASFFEKKCTSRVSKLRNPPI